MPRHVPLRRPLSAVALIALLALPAIVRAGEPAPAASAGKPGAGGAAITAPGAVTASPTAIAPAPKPYVPRTAEERALLDLQNETHRSIDALVTAMNGLNDGPDRRALQQRIVQAKVDYEVQSLRIKAQFARGRGDLAAAQAAEDRIESILHPKPVVPVATQRPTPDKSDVH